MDQNDQVIPEENFDNDLYVLGQDLGNVNQDYSKLANSPEFLVNLNLEKPRK